jgi:hypothetical protein
MYQSTTSPFNLWSLPDSLNGPSFAPCHNPYGEQPASKVSTAFEHAAVIETFETDATGSRAGLPVLLLSAHWTSIRLYTALDHETSAICTFLQAL